MDAPESAEDDQILCEIIEKKIQIAELKLKKRLLLEELYRQFFEGEKEPKKRKRREVKQEENAVTDAESNNLSNSNNNPIKRRRPRGSVAASVAASHSHEADA